MKISAINQTVSDSTILMVSDCTIQSVSDSEFHNKSDYTVNTISDFLVQEKFDSTVQTVADYTSQTVPEFKEQKLSNQSTINKSDPMNLVHSKNPLPSFLQTKSNSIQNEMSKLKFSHKFKKTRIYRSYNKDHQLVNEVYSVFSTKSRQDYSLKEITNLTSIPEKVLSSWRKAF